MGGDGRPPPRPRPLPSRTALHDAAPGYLDDHQWDQVGGTDWFPNALNELTAQHRHLPGPLLEHQPRPGEPQQARPLYRLADYLEQHAPTERAHLSPPASFWDAAARHTLHDLYALGKQAEDRGRYRHAALLYRRAADTGNPDALMFLAWRREVVDDREGAEWFYRQAADPGDTDSLWFMGQLRKDAGDRQGAERLYQQITDGGVEFLAQMREEAGDRQGAEQLRRFGLTAAGDVEKPWTWRPVQVRLQAPRPTGSALGQGAPSTPRHWCR